MINLLIQIMIILLGLYLTLKIFGSIKIDRLPFNLRKAVIIANSIAIFISSIYIIVLSYCFIYIIIGGV